MILIFYKKKNALSQENKEGLCYQYVKLLMWSNMYRQLKFYKFNFVGFHNKMKKTRSLIYNLFEDWKENKYIKNNQEYFRARLGNNFVERFDYIGENILKTSLVLSILVIKNKKRH